jgi:hypothetical protein
VAAPDGPVRVADAQAGLVGAAGHLELVGGGGRGHLDRVAGVQAGDVAQDAVALLGPEVVSIDSTMRAAPSPPTTAPVHSRVIRSGSVSTAAATATAPTAAAARPSRTASVPRRRLVSTSQTVARGRIPPAEIREAVAPMEPGGRR